ncbi:Yip1-domain-containing protein [Peniophora sp. CONT]|nr:Yip1-domain-containing protein [Peniophora sp. CONT]
MASTPQHANQFIPADDSDEDLDDEDIPGFGASSAPTTPLIPTPAADKGKGRAIEQLASPAPQLSGNIGGSGNGTAGSGIATGNARRQAIGGVRVETRSGGIDTLDEPITTTLGRDLISIYNKLIQVLYPLRKGEAREVLKDWDLWGPLILCLALAIMLSVNAPPAQSLSTFTSVVVIVCIGSLVVTVQTKLLGGRLSFFQGLCVLGYCVAPLDVAALIACFVRIIYVRAPIALLAWAWSMWASVNFLDGTHIQQDRIVLAVYPISLFYFILAWMILIQ